MKMSGEYEPNDGHDFLANLEKQGKHVDMFTQNIDGLHKRAGSQHVYELHGSIQKPLVHLAGRHMNCLIY